MKIRLFKSDRNKKSYSKYHKNRLSRICTKPMDCNGNEGTLMRGLSLKKLIGIRGHILKSRNEKTPIENLARIKAPIEEPY